MTQRTKFFGLFAALTLIFTASASQAEPIKVSYQPALYWALPFYVATQKGYWKDVGLEPEFSTFPAGVPQIAAAAAKSWDVGGTGSVPAVLGFARFGIMTIGITNDESATNALMVAGDKAADYGNGKNLAAAKGKVITVTQNSTADYAIQSCLKMAGLSKTDVVMKNMGQAEIISALSAGQTELAGLWSPNIYTVEEKSGAKMLCNGRDSG
ncbi:MAG: ABC transporter substrate-binding protein, partial [Alphaproteobacteria bacterium]|nr:ABC transporter substrate-binding protein [Alphaproteobacteria bacterium]